MEAAGNEHAVSSESPNYWLSRPAAERLRAVEQLRRNLYGDSVTTRKLERVLEVIQLEEL